MRPGDSPSVASDTAIDLLLPRPEAEEELREPLLRSDVSGGWASRWLLRCSVSVGVCGEELEAASC